MRVVNFHSITATTKQRRNQVCHFGVIRLNSGAVHQANSWSARRRRYSDKDPWARHKCETGGNAFRSNGT
jgi:hypothetical protein